jgi:hypothetical protein
MIEKLTERKLKGRINIRNNHLDHFSCPSDLYYSIWAKSGTLDGKVYLLCSDDSWLYEAFIGREEKPDSHMERDG